MEAHRGSRLGLAILVALAVLLELSCEKAERLAFPPEPAPPVPSLTGEQGSGDSLGFGVIEVAVIQLDSIMTGELVLVFPGPLEFIRWLQHAYAQRDASMLASLLAEDYTCTAITRSGTQSWGKEEEILIHERMFDPECAVRPIANIELTLENMVATPVDSGGSGQHLFRLDCTAHLVLEYANPADGVFAFLGPAEFVVRRSQDPPVYWELVEWRDHLPAGAR